MDNSANKELIEKDLEGLYLNLKPIVLDYSTLEDIILE